MSRAGEALVACLHHPPDPDLDALRRRLSRCARPIELIVAPYKENLRLRAARAEGPLDASHAREAPAPDAAVRDAWARAEVLLTLDLPSEHLAELPRLRWLQTYSSGVDHFDLDAFATRGVRVTNAAGVGAVPIAEFVVGRLLEVWKGSRALDAHQESRRLRQPPARLLAGATLGLIGYGAIGRAVARRARAFDMRIVACRRHPERREGVEWLDALHGPEGLHRLLAESDAVVLCAPETAETRDLIGAEALGAMREGAVLCNVARGRLVDEAALIGALRSGRLAAAILDVTRHEPLDAADPLWSAPNLYLSPHCAALPDAYDERMLELFARNLERYAAGEALENLVGNDRREERS